MGFEIPFTPFEELMAARDTPAYPCDIWIRMPLVGRIDKVIFEKCVQRWLELNPLLACKAVSGWGGHRWRSQSANVSIRWIDKPTNQDADWPEPEALGLEQGTSMFFVIAESVDSQPSSTSTLYLQFHHSLADGLGIVQALHELWILYDEMISGRKHRHPVRSIDDLAQRNRFGLTTAKLLRMLPQQAVGLAGVRQFLSRKPSPLVPHALPNTPPNRIKTVSQSLPAEMLTQLRKFARSRQATLHECICASLFAAISQYRQLKAVESPSDWIRVMIPMNMRSSHDKEKLSACNIVSAVFLDRTPEQIRDQGRLLSGIHAEMELIKTNKLAFMFLFSVWLRKLFTWGRPTAKANKHCETTFVFSNLGKVFGESPLCSTTHELTAGNVTIKEVELLAPLNPYMISAFTFMQYGQQGRLTLRYDDRVLLESDAIQLMHFVQQHLHGQIADAGA